MEKWRVLMIFGDKVGKSSIDGAFNGKPHDSHVFKGNKIYGKPSTDGIEINIVVLGQKRVLAEELLARGSMVESPAYRMIGIT